MVWELFRPGHRICIQIVGHVVTLFITVQTVAIFIFTCLQFSV